MANQLKAYEDLPTDREELMRFLQRAQNGDAATLPALRKALKDPAAIKALGGDLAWQAEESLVRAMAGKDLAFREALSRKLELLRAELAGPSPSPLERLLVERVVACWLHVQEADISYAQAKNLPLPLADYYQRRMDRANKRFLAACKTLATVRRLAIPVLIGQVNLASKQVNVAATTPQAKG